MRVVVVPLVLCVLLGWGRTASSFAWTPPPPSSSVQRGHRVRVLPQKHLQWQPFLQVATYPLVDIVQPAPLHEYRRPTVKERMKQLCQKYVVLNERRPLATKGVSAAIVQGMGDLLSQYLTAIAAAAATTTGQPHFQWNMLRTLTFMFIGLCYKGPVLHLWYKALAKIAQWTKVRRGFSETQQSLTALTVDQTIGVAIFYPLYFVVYELVSSMVSLQAPNLLALPGKMVTTMIPIILAQYYVWPAAQFVSFQYVPAPLRVLYTNLVAVFWNCFLCARLVAATG